MSVSSLLHLPSFSVRLILSSFISLYYSRASSLLLLATVCMFPLPAICVLSASFVFFFLPMVRILPPLCSSFSFLFLFSLCFPCIPILILFLPVVCVLLPSFSFLFPPAFRISPCSSCSPHLPSSFSSLFLPAVHVLLPSLLISCCSSCSPSLPPSPPPYFFLLFVCSLLFLSRLCTKTLFNRARAKTSRLAPEVAPSNHLKCAVLLHVFFPR